MRHSLRNPGVGYVIEKLLKSLRSLSYALLVSYRMLILRANSVDSYRNHILSKLETQLFVLLYSYYAKS